MIVGIGVRNAKTANKVTALLLAGKDNQAAKLASSQTAFPTFDVACHLGRCSRR
jgi:hypothetical protein